MKAGFKPWGRKDGTCYHDLVEKAAEGNIANELSCKAKATGKRNEKKNAVALLYSSFMRVQRCVPHLVKLGSRWSTKPVHINGFKTRKWYGSCAFPKLSVHDSRTTQATASKHGVPHNGRARGRVWVFPKHGVHDGRTTQATASKHRVRHNDRARVRVRVYKVNAPQTHHASYFSLSTVYSTVLSQFGTKENSWNLVGLTFVSTVSDKLAPQITAERVIRIHRTRTLLL